MSKADEVSLQNAQEDPTLGLAPLKKPGPGGHAKQRSDKKEIHFTRCGLLSRDIMRALVKEGESLRTIRRYEKKFRSAFKPRGTLREFFFDRFWSCYLRLHLIARLEAKALTSDCLPGRKFPTSDLREGLLPILVSHETEQDQDVGAELSENVFRELALAQRYDRHYAREASRMLALLLAMRKGGKAALEKVIGGALDLRQNQRQER